MKHTLCGFALALGLVSCGNPTATTPAPPNSPQTQVLNIDKTLADAINAMVKAAVLLGNQGKVSRPNVVLIESWSKSAVALDDAIATELGSADPWSVQKTKILAMLPGLKVPAISGLDPTVQADLVAITAIIGQIQAQVTQ